ncbi:PTS sugar transporter subunit IIA [Parolsenella catena]|uniref:PTS sugar transporter subunit IIA n=1 Tax=Parolsenella catena TaxID=2003188 RepID=UPI003AEF1CAD
MDHRWKSSLFLGRAGGPPSQPYVKRLRYRKVVPVGLFSKIKASNFGGTAVSRTPSAIDANLVPGGLCAPVSGKAASLAEVPDPIFAGEVLGKGGAIWPDSDVVYAPISGTVSVAMPHAMGIIGDEGIEALVHVGIDTVEMGGAGFDVFAEKCARVVAGQPLARIDRDAIAKAGHPDCVVLVVSNTAEFSSIEMLAGDGAAVSAGETFLHVSK